MHKFKILKTEKGEFRVQFVYNAEIMVWSENYASKASAKNCVESLKKNAPAAPTPSVYPSAGALATIDRPMFPPAPGRV